MNEDRLKFIADVAVRIQNNKDNIGDKEIKYALALSGYIAHVCSEIKLYETVCTYSFQNNMDGQLDAAISNFVKDKTIWDLLRIFGTLAWEKRFRTGKTTYPFEVEIARLFVISNSDLPQDIVEYIDFVQPVIICHHMLIDNGNALNNAKDVDKKLDIKVNNISSLIERWNEELVRLEVIATRLRSELNFVGLSSAYMDLLNKKENERKYYIWYMFSFFVLIIITPFVIPSIMAHAGYILSVDPKASGDSIFWMSISSRVIVSAPFFLIFLYIFRINLRNFQSVRAQIVQLQIRQAVCQFVQAYSDYVVQQSAVLKDNGEHLKKFESLVFSGLTPDPDNVPSTFDGLDQIIEAVKAIRK